MVDVQTISIAIASASVVAGVIYYSLQISNQTKTRHTDIILKLYSTFSSKEFQKTWAEVLKREAKDYDDYEKKYGQADAVEIGMFFEGIGVLLRRKIIDIELVDDLFTGPIKETWKKMRDITLEARRLRNQPEVFEWFEYLYNELQKREQKLQSKT